MQNANSPKYVEEPQKSPKKILEPVKRELFGVMEDRFFEGRNTDNIKKLIAQCKKFGVRIILDGRQLAIYINEQDFEKLGKQEKNILQNLAENENVIECVFGYKTQGFHKIKYPFIKIESR